MAVCEYCGKTYRGGAAVGGKHRFCTHQCRDKGVILDQLDGWSDEDIWQYIDEASRGPCPECGADAPIDVHKFHDAWSVIIWTSWKTGSKVCCRACGFKEQRGAAIYTGLRGWWGFPWGFITPIQIVRNIVAMSRKASGIPSSDFVRIVKLNLAARIAAARRAEKQR
jgi:hypothetical protein